jgi:hypothetical protein
MSVPVPTGAETHTAPVEYKSGRMGEDATDGDRNRKVAFITGVTGQDGSYLVELLLSKGTIGVRFSTSARGRVSRRESRISVGCWIASASGKKFPHSRSSTRRPRRVVANSPRDRWGISLSRFPRRFGALNVQTTPAWGID